MAKPLTDAHLTILRAAAGRPDALLIPPDRLLGAARNRMAARLVALGMVAPVKVMSEEPKWLVEADGSVIGLRLTEAGRVAAAAAMTLQEPAQAEPERVSDAVMAVDLNCSPAKLRARRPGSKAALLLDLVGRDGSASLDALCDALGWQPHTVRAALTRLRQGGAPVSRVAGEHGRGIYCLAPAAERPSDGSLGSADARDGVA